MDRCASYIKASLYYITTVHSENSAEPLKQAVRKRSPRSDEKWQILIDNSGKLHHIRDHHHQKTSMHNPNPMQKPPHACMHPHMGMQMHMFMCMHIRDRNVVFE